MLGKDDDGADAARAAGIFPALALHRADEFAFPHQLRRRKVVEVHSSISLSGISLTSPSVRGKCSASTTPTCSIAATIPSPTRPSLTWTSNALIASPQVSGV